jgi:hypothetical protein
LTIVAASRHALLEIAETIRKDRFRDRGSDAGVRACVRGRNNYPLPDAAVNVIDR